MLEGNIHLIDIFITVNLLVMFLTQQLSIMETRGCHRETLSHKQLFYVLCMPVTHSQVIICGSGEKQEKKEKQREREWRLGRSEGL